MAHDELAQQTLLKAFREFQVHYYAELPYNLNWMLDGLEDEGASEYFRRNPLRVVDVGARHGCPGELAGLRPFLEYHAFDADPEEHLRLSRDSVHGMARRHVHRCFVGSENGQSRFHLCERAAESSGLAPNEDLAGEYEIPRVQRVIEVESRTLDRLLQEEVLSGADFLKLDTQGTELAVLQGAARLLESCHLVEVEVEFVPLYRGQALFPEVCSWMFAQGYELLYLNRVFQSKKGFTGPSRGQHVFGDALFGRPDRALKQREPVELVPYVVLLANYGHLDIAYRIYNSQPAIRARVNLDFLFRPSSLTPREQEEAVARDKELCWHLAARRTNQLPSDSDRSWPFR